MKIVWSEKCVAFMAPPARQATAGSPAELAGAPISHRLRLPGARTGDVISDPEKKPRFVTFCAFLSYGAT